MPRQPVRPLALKGDEGQTLPFNVHLYKEKAADHSDPANATDLPPREDFQMTGGKKNSRLLYPGIAGSVLGSNEGSMGI